MPTLLQKYQEQLIINGIPTSDVQNHRVEKLKKCLTSKYGSSLTFFSQKSPTEPRIAYGSDTDIVSVINTAYSYKKILFCNDIEQAVLQAVIHVLFFTKLI